MSVQVASISDVVVYIYMYMFIRPGCLSGHVVYQTSYIAYQAGLRIRPGCLSGWVAYQGAWCLSSQVAYWTGFHSRSGCISATPAPKQPPPWWMVSYHWTM